MKEADLLCSDAINNFKTVQSFGHENMFVKKYRSILEPLLKANQTEHLKAGLIFGFTQWSEYLVFGILFYAGAEILERNSGGDDPVDPTDVFIAIFALFFACQQAGMAAAFGPDIGNA